MDFLLSHPGETGATEAVNICVGGGDIALAVGEGDDREDAGGNKGEEFVKTQSELCISDASYYKINLERAYFSSLASLVWLSCPLSL